MEIIKKIIKYVIFLILVIGIGIGILNGIMIQKEKKKIVTKQQIEEIKEVDCILILGAGIRNNQPSPMLEDRLLEGIDLYKSKVAPKIIMSGDHGKEGYDEVNVMKQYAIEKGVPSEDIFMDHAGFSSYDSVYRAKEIFKVKKMIVVTQKYHLYRTLYIADRLEIDAYGIPSNPRKYIGQWKREVREILARSKDFFQCTFKIKPKYLGETIPVNGNGDITNDK